MKVPTEVVGRTRPSAQGLAYLSDAGATPEAFGAGVGRGLQALSGGIGELAARTKQRTEQTDRFTSLINFSDFETRVNERLTELKRGADPTGKGFTALAEAEYKKASNEFLVNDVTPELRPEFTFRAAQVRQRILGDALTFQYQAGDAYFRTGIDKEYQGALKGLNPDTGGDPTKLEDWKDRVFETIEASDLSEIEKEELKRKTSIGMEGVSYKQAVKQGIAKGAMNLSSSVGGIIDSAAAKYGVPAEALRTVAWLESRGNPNAQNPNSSAGGLFQFIDSTAAQYGVGNKMDAGESADGAARLMADNAAGLRKTLGREPTTGELYLAHQQGLGGAQALLRNPNALATDVVGVDAVRLNGGAPGMTAGQFANLWISKAEGANPDLDNNPAFANLPYEDRVALRADAGREATQEASAVAAQQKLAIDTQFNALMNNIAYGQGGQAEIDAGVQEGWLSDYDSRKKAQDALDKKTETTALVAGFTAMLNSEFPVIDPSDENFKKAYNAWVGPEGLAKITDGDQAYITNGIVPTVTKLGDIPTDVVGTLTGMVRSNNQTKALFALDTLAQLQNADPRAYDARVNDKLASDVETWRELKDLYPPAELMGAINGGQTQEDRQRNAILRKEAQDILTAKQGGVSTLQTLVQGVVGEFGGALPFSSPALSGVPAFARALDLDYQTAFTEAYIKTGDTDRANELATKTLKRSWGVTSIGGNSILMKFPPEQTGYKALGGDYSWIDKQVRSEMELTPDTRFELISDGQTKQEFAKWQRGEGPPASYLVTTFDEFGTGRSTMVRRYFVPTEVDKAEDVRLFEFERVKRDILINEATRLQSPHIPRGPIVEEEYQENKSALQKRLNELNGATPSFVDPGLETSFGGAL